MSLLCLMIIKSFRSCSASSSYSSLVAVTCGKGIVSLHRMKRLFCDNCINNILDATKNQILDVAEIFCV